MVFKGRYRLRFLEPQLLKDRTDPPPPFIADPKLQTPGTLSLFISIIYIIIIHYTKLHKTEILKNKNYTRSIYNTLKLFLKINFLQMAYIVATHSRGLHDNKNVHVSKIILLCTYIERKCRYIISDRSLTLLRVHYSQQVIKSIFSQAL